MLQGLAGMAQVTEEGPTSDGVQEFHANLQRLCGTPVDTSVTPVVSTAGLSALASLWAAMLLRGGADVLMCSTAYGGSSELTSMGGDMLRQHEFHIQGKADLMVSFRAALEALTESGAATFPNLVLFLEIPTNPDMKVPDMGQLGALCVAHRERTGKNVILVVDTTFSPGSQVMRKLREQAKDLTVLCFISMSKSMSRGLTTAGAIVANHTTEAKEIVRSASDACQLLDVGAKPDQLKHLVENHGDVVERCVKAHGVASAVGDNFQQAVLEATGQDMPLAFVSQEQVDRGFTSATFSFNLPSPKGATAEVKELFAQRFVDALCIHKEFKPCVSFGQDNGLVYVTVPSTSTQGVISAESKAKQAIGGVQLARLSFPPTCDVESVCRILRDAVSAMYK